VCLLPQEFKRINDPDGSVEQLIHAEAARLDAYLRSMPELLFPFGQETQTGRER
jgi:hypothetical protein